MENKTRTKEKITSDIGDFFKEIENVCLKYNFSIAHEDYQGGFIIESYDKYNINWLKSASVDIASVETGEGTMGYKVGDTVVLKKVVLKKDFSNCIDTVHEMRMWESDIVEIVGCYDGRYKIEQDRGMWNWYEDHIDYEATAKLHEEGLND